LRFGVQATTSKSAVERAKRNIMLLERCKNAGIADKSSHSALRVA
jgi:hypothetical protein